MRKTDGNMKKMIEYLERTPVVESACAKLGISRSTYYRWIESDAEFKKKVEVALQQGRSVVDDVAESHLISGIKGGNMAAVKFWLANNNDRYKKSVQVIKEEMPSVPVEVIEKFISLMFSKRHEEGTPEA